MGCEHVNVDQTLPAVQLAVYNRQQNLYPKFLLRELTVLLLQNLDEGCRRYLASL
jgi:hypothetical protein